MHELEWAYLGTFQEIPGRILASVLIDRLNTANVLNGAESTLVQAKLPQDVSADPQAYPFGL